MTEKPGAASQADLRACPRTQPAKNAFAPALAAEAKRALEVEAKRARSEGLPVYSLVCPVSDIVFARKWFNDVVNFPEDCPLFPVDAEANSGEEAEADSGERAEADSGERAEADSGEGAEADVGRRYAVAWLRGIDRRCLWTWNATGHLRCHQGADADVPPPWLPPPLPPARVHYGGPEGDPRHELLDATACHARLGFVLSASLTLGSAGLQRSLALDNLDEEALPEELRPPIAACEALVAAVRSGGRLGAVFVAPDAWGGHGLFAGTDLAAGTLLGEYVGSLCRETAGGGAAERGDTYMMRYPDSSGSLYVSALDEGSLMRFVNHAPRGEAANNTTCWAVLVDGAYHIVVVTTRAVRAMEEFAYDYGAEYWHGLKRSGQAVASA